MIKLWLSQHGSATYTVKMGGEVIVKGSRIPICTACRRLKERGFSGGFEVWSDHDPRDPRVKVEPYRRMTGVVERVARLTVDEKSRPYFKRYQSFQEILDDAAAE